MGIKYDIRTSVDDAMKYRELYDEYTDLFVRETVLRQEMYGIPKGYLVTKKIGAA